MQGPDAYLSLPPQQVWLVLVAAAAAMVLVLAVAGVLYLRRRNGLTKQIGHLSGNSFYHLPGTIYISNHYQKYDRYHMIPNKASYNKTYILYSEHLSSYYIYSEHGCSRHVIVGPMQYSSKLVYNIKKCAYYSIKLVFKVLIDIQYQA